MAEEGGNSYSKRLAHRHVLIITQREFVDRHLHQAVSDVTHMIDLVRMVENGNDIPLHRHPTTPLPHDYYSILLSVPLVGTLLLPDRSRSSREHLAYHQTADVCFHRDGRYGIPDRLQAKGTPFFQKKHSVLHVQHLRDAATLLGEASAELRETAKQGIVFLAISYSLSREHKHNIFPPLTFLVLTPVRQ